MLGRYPLFYAVSVSPEDNVYLCTGSPRPRDIKTVLNHLMNSSFRESYEGVRAVQVSSGAALTDILGDLTKHILVLELPSDVKRFLLIKMADIEYNLSFATIESVQLAALVSAFVLARTMYSTHRE